MSHILFINHTRELHGAEQVFIQTLRVAHEAGHRVSVLLPSHVPDSGLDKAVTPYADTVLHLPYRPAGNNGLRTSAIHVYNSYALWKTIRYIRREKVELVYSNTIVTTLGIIAARRTKRPHLWHIHEMPHELFGWHSSLASLYRRLMRYGNNRLVCISEYQKQAWQKELQIPFSAEIIYNPIRRMDVVSQPHRHVRIGYMGVFDKRKNLPLLLNAFEYLHTRFPKTELWLCGAKNTDETEEIYAQIALKEPVVSVFRTTDDIVSFFSQTDIFVLPSWEETMPLVVLEAMQAGVCVLQTDRSGMKELLEDGKESLFFSPEDEEGLVALLTQCMDTDFRQKIAFNGQKRVNELMSTLSYDARMRDLLDHD